ncbi:hypothetical protein J437_LFUL016601 [Ladona fulva]|uniref:Zinc transporter ZIP13 n=1 Tax=Ladona fulva TaxID=123851 RepID=A0A8K0P938_LADFU|nr:hypothetical protein J437_LFUL016601 [Ladona fulva]
MYIQYKYSGQHIWTGMWVLVGMLVFIIVEKCCSSEKEEQKEDIEDFIEETVMHKEKIAKTINNNVHEASENSELCDFENHSKVVGQPPPKKYDFSKNFFYFRTSYLLLLNKLLNFLLTYLANYPTFTLQHVAGYLNLVANSIDNFTHGLAVGGGFYISLRVGIFTTLAILVHEVPHEIGDFAILMRSGFSRWDAARAQLLTGSAGVLGALAASIGAADEAGDSVFLHTLKIL